MDELIALCFEYLGKTHSTLWGQTWNVYEGDGRQEAATWLATVISEVLEPEGGWDS